MARCVLPVLDFSMKILHLSHTVTAYAPARFVHLINKYTPHEARLIQIVEFFIGNPHNLDILRKDPEITEALEWADVLHFHGSHIFEKRKIIVQGKKIRIDKYYKKPYVLHYHGSPHRERYKKFQRAVPLLVSTPEMRPLFKNAKFFPNLIDETSDLYAIRDSFSNDLEKLKLCNHFSYHHRIKDGHVFQTANVYFARNGKESKFVFHQIPMMELVEVLKARAKFDIVFDHLQGYYGLVSTEGMAQGLCVINGATERTMHELERFFGSRPPFCRATRSNLVQVIGNLTWESVDEYGRQGREYMEKVWSGKKNIGRLIDFYEGL